MLLDLVAVPNWLSLLLSSILVSYIFYGESYNDNVDVEQLRHTCKVMRLLRRICRNVSTFRLAAAIRICETDSKFSSSFGTAIMLQIETPEEN
jgi:hypothetical protein